MKHSIPDSLRAGLKNIPDDRPVTLLMRHSTRGPIPHGEMGDDIRLTEEGHELARELGTRLPRIVSVHSSPIARCVETGEGILEGARCELEIRHDRLLGDPGVYIGEPAAAWKTFCSLRLEELVLRMCRPDASLPGFNNPGAAAARLLGALADRAEVPGLHLSISHDIYIAMTAAMCFGRSYVQPEWPKFVEAMFIWRENGGLRVSFREDSAVLRHPVTPGPDGLTCLL